MKEDNGEEVTHRVRASLILRVGEESLVFQHLVERNLIDVLQVQEKRGKGKHPSCSVDLTRNLRVWFGKPILLFGGNVRI